MVPRAVWAVEFPGSGSRYEGDTATQVLRRLSKAQWTDEARVNVKRALAWRAYVMTGETVDESADDCWFLTRLAEIGVARVLVTIDGEVTEL